MLPRLADAATGFLVVNEGECWRAGECFIAVVALFSPTAGWSTIFPTVSWVKMQSYVDWLFGKTHSTANR